MKVPASNNNALFIQLKTIPKLLMHLFHQLIATLNKKFTAPRIIILKPNIPNIQWYQIYSDTKYTVIPNIQWYQIYSDTKYTVTPNIQWHQIYSDTKYTMIPNIQWYQIYSDTKYTVVCNMPSSAHLFYFPDFESTWRQQLIMFWKYELNMILPCSKL